MSIVTFWNADREQSGVSISTVAVATKMAIELKSFDCFSSI